MVVWRSNRLSPVDRTEMAERLRKAKSEKWAWPTPGIFKSLYLGCLTTDLIHFRPFGSAC
jgi:hypothetical protein